MPPKNDVLELIMKQLEKQEKKIEGIPNMIRAMLSEHRKNSKEIHELKMNPLIARVKKLETKQEAHASELTILKFFKWQAVSIVTVILVLGNFAIKFFFGI